MLGRWKVGRAGWARNERGAATTEYAPLLVVIAILVVVAVSFAGPWISEQLSDASEPMDPDASMVRVSIDARGTV